MQELGLPCPRSLQCGCLLLETRDLIPYLLLKACLFHLETLYPSREFTQQEVLATICPVSTPVLPREAEVDLRVFGGFAQRPELRKAEVTGPAFGSSVPSRTL